jgi:hypothetical protein
VIEAGGGGVPAGRPRAVDISVENEVVGRRKPWTEGLEVDESQSHD